MPNEPDEIEDMIEESSTPIEDVVSEQAEQAEQAETAESSTATDESEPDTLSLVRDVVGEKKDEPEAAASSAEGEEGQGEGADDQNPKDPSDDYSDVPFNKHPRFQSLIRERNELRGPAQEYQKITAFMDAHALTAEEAANALTIVGLAKLDPTEAFKQIAPWFRKIAEAAGEILPQDLADRVQKGELSQDVAFELSRTRAKTSAQTARQQFETQRQQTQQQTASVRAVADAARTWEQDRQLKDPNFAAKAPRIAEKIAFLHATGQKPNTPEGVLAQLKMVYEAVNRELGAQSAAQSRQQRRPEKIPVRGGQVAATRPATPSGKMSTVDIIKSTLGKGA